MLPQATSSVLTVSPPETFSPRREFVRENHVSSSFALLAIAGPGFVRLSSFSPLLVASLRQMFQYRFLLRTIREEKNLDLIEFSLEGKPWSQTKNIESEKIFVELLAVVFQHGYKFLSTIDYGREHDDRVSIAFSKPVSVQVTEAALVPFALSFPSSTILRVINPPLSTSPAILQAARSAWPRGVILEKMVSEKCYEFRLKGYRWFQEDTFSADSLHQIFHLLNALDRHAFSLLTSISLSGNHSRVKDLWIFSGPPPDTSSDAPINNLNGELPRSLSAQGMRNAPFPLYTSLPLGGANHSGDALHVRSGSLPGSSSTLGHARHATEPITTGPSHARNPLISSSVLHKKSSSRPSGATPMVQSPLARPSEEESFGRRRDATANENVDMTGVGSATQRNFFAARGKGAARTPSRRAFPRSSTEIDAIPQLSQQHKTANRAKSENMYYESQPPDYSAHLSSVDSSSDSREISRQLTLRDSAELPNEISQSLYGRAESEARTDSTPPILSSALFRDSAFSSATSHSCEIPITWTGTSGSEKGKERDSSDNPGMSVELKFSPEMNEGYTEEPEIDSENMSQPSKRHSAALKLPGGWRPTPIDEIPEDQGGLASHKDSQRRGERGKSPERREVDAERVASPTMSDTPGATRKSEVALYGVVSGQVLRGAFEQESRSSGASPSSPASKADGWVLVNVAEGTLDQPMLSQMGKTEISNATYSSLDIKGKSPPRSSLSPIVKAVVAEDAISSTQKSPSRFKRFLPGSKSKTRALPTNARASRVKTFEQEEQRRKPSLRDKWRKKVPLDT